MEIPPAMMYDSSAVEGVREAASVNIPMTMTPSGKGWLLTLTPDQAWLADPQRQYPVAIDPTLDIGVDDVYSYRSDGASFHDGGRIGNARANGDAYWRTLVHYPYANFGGKQVIDAAVYAAMDGGGTVNQYPAEIQWGFELRVRAGPGSPWASASSGRTGGSTASCSRRVWPGSSPAAPRRPVPTS